MNFDWILNPLTPFVMIALALVAFLVCFLSTKSEVYRLRRIAAEAQRQLAHKLEAVESTVASIGKQQAELPAATPVLRPSLNLTRRTQALRMRRRGESAESIAAALSAPRNEIELLLKVYEIVEYRKSLAAPPETAA